MSAVCHGPAALANVKLSIGTYLIAGQNFIGISDVEEDIIQFSRDMSSLLETELREYGGIYEKAVGPFGVKVLTSGENGKLYTSQNTSSSALVGDNIIRAAGMYFAMLLSNTSFSIWIDLVTLIRDRWASRIERQYQDHWLCSCLTNLERNMVHDPLVILMLISQPIRAKLSARCSRRSEH